MQRLLLEITLEHRHMPHMDTILVRAFSEKDNKYNDYHNINSYVEVEQATPNDKNMSYHFKQVLPFHMERDVWYNTNDYEITSIEIVLQKETDN